MRRYGVCYLGGLGTVPHRASLEDSKYFRVTPVTFQSQPPSFGATANFLPDIHSSSGRKYIPPAPLRYYRLLGGDGYIAIDTKT